MGRITEEIVHIAYETAKGINQNKLSRRDGLKVLTDLGMKESSANYYIYCYKYFITGELFTGTINRYATDYYLKKIHQEKGMNGLKIALHSLSKHIEHYNIIKRPSVYTKDIYEKYSKLIDTLQSESIYPDEIDNNDSYFEGNPKQVFVNYHERNPIARKKCIEYFGLTCQVCEFNFEEKFGDLGIGFIHVHHRVDISIIGKEYSVDPIKDLVPVCPNCHVMLHKKKPAYSISELKGILSNNSNK